MRAETSDVLDVAKWATKRYILCCHRIQCRQRTAMHIMVAYSKLRRKSRLFSLKDDG
jgi:hypothetical protein